MSEQFQIHQIGSRDLVFKSPLTAKEAPRMCDCGDTALLGGICQVCGKPAPGGLADPNRLRDEQPGKR